MPSATFDTTRSDQITSDFLATNTLFRRKVQSFGRELSSSPGVVFAQLCPAREADWISGWTVELIYTRSGHAEPLAVFRTPESAQLGAGIWIRTTVEPDRLLEATVLYDGGHLHEHVRIEVSDLGSDRCTATSTITLTALTEQGNALVDSIPDGATPDLIIQELLVTIAAGVPLVWIAAHVVTNLP